MHDMWFASKIIVCLKDKIGNTATPKHITVNIALGPFTHVTQGGLRAAFQMLIKKEDFKNITLNINKNQAFIECKKCGYSAQISNPILACPKCQSTDLDIKNNEEFLIQSVEIDN